MTGHAQDIAVSLTGVTASYDGPPVLHDVSLNIPQKSVAGIIGPNGAGKTTLLRVVAGSRAAGSGNASVFGRDVSRWPARDRARHIAFVAQSLHLALPYTLREFVAIGRTPHAGEWARLSAADRGAVDRALTEVELEARADKDVEDLSEGERQRAVLAMALAQEPRLLLLDEPTAHLDVHHAWRFMDTVRSLVAARGLTVIMTSHDLNLSAAFCSRMILLSEGRIAAHGEPSEVLRDELLSRVYRHPMTTRATPEGLSVLPGMM